MRKVTKIQAVSKTRYQIYLEEQFAFTLYKGELLRYHICEGGELSEAAVKEIKEKILLKRAKMRAMHLLNDMDRTESQLRSKLEGSGYPEDVTEAAIAYVKSFGYINDEAYIRRFIDFKKHTKSRREICAHLMQKGVDRELVQEVLEEYYHQEDTQQAIRELLRKKRFDPATAEDPERRRIYAYLARKGFGCEDIRRAMQMDWCDS